MANVYRLTDFLVNDDYSLDAIFLGSMIAAMKPIHPLRRYLFENQTNARKFAGRIGASQGYLSEIMNYAKRPSLDFIDKVRAATKGEIDASSFDLPKMQNSRKRRVTA